MLMISLILVNALALAVIYKQIHKYYSKRNKNIQNSINIVTSLNISHLHDAANFFTLLQRKLEQQSIKQESNFAKGAAYHFRSLFEELRDSKNSFLDCQSNPSQEESIKLLYKKSEINLYDLLELELLELCHFERIQIQSNSQSAWILGNFSLLSKVLLNLVENALKYTDQNIVIELNKLKSGVELKIKSYGNGIPQKVINSINAQHLNGFYGHGLESLQDIMQFHEAEYSVDTLDGSGSSIKLKFPNLNKFPENNSDLTNNKLTQSSNPFQQSLFKVKPSLTYRVAIIILLLFSTSYQNLCAWTYCRDIDSILAKEEYHKSLNVKNEIEELFKIQQNNKLLEYLDARNKFLNNFPQEEQDTISFLLLQHLENTNSPIYFKFQQEESHRLASKYPQSISLSYIELKSTRQILFIGKLFFQSIRNFFYPDPETLMLEKIVIDKDNLYKFISSKKINTLKIQNNQINELNKMIEKQDRALGIKQSL